MTTDGGLRQLYQKHLPTFHWQGVETWSTGQGVPDCNFCAEGSEGWIENKVTHTNAIKFQTEQIGWIERRRRAGGRVFIGVRKTWDAGPRKGAAGDLFYLFAGDAVRALAVGGLGAAIPILMCSGGPAKWAWPEIRTNLLTFFVSFPAKGH
jgi:hypothetical protein